MNVPLIPMQRLEQATPAAAIARKKKYTVKRHIPTVKEIDVPENLEALPKHEQRKIKNRISATAHRKRQRDYVLWLEGEKSSLEQQNTEYRKRLRVLEDIIKRMGVELPQAATGPLPTNPSHFQPAVSYDDDSSVTEYSSAHTTSSDAEDAPTAVPSIPTSTYSVRATSGANSTEPTALGLSAG